MTDYYLIRGMSTVGTITVDPYDYEYQGNDSLVEIILDEGPPQTRMTGADTEADPELHADTIEQLDSEAQLSEFEADLAAVGVELQAAPDIE